MDSWMDFHGLHGFAFFKFSESSIIMDSQIWEFKKFWIRRSRIHRIQKKLWIGKFVFFESVFTANRKQIPGFVLDSHSHCCESTWIRWILKMVRIYVNSLDSLILWIFLDSNVDFLLANTGFAKQWYWHWHSRTHRHYHLYLHQINRQSSSPGNQKITI